MPVFTSSIEVTADYPTIKPSLNLNFARSCSLDPRITFTRASTATYIGRDGLVKYAGVDEARFDHDPDTLESLGLLIEEQRTNRAYGTPSASQGAVYLGQNNSLTGTNNAILFGKNSPTAGQSNLNWNVSGTVSTTSFVFSVFVKEVNTSTFFLQLVNNPVNDNLYVYYNVATGGTAFTDFAAAGNLTVTPSIENYVDGWYRLIVRVQGFGNGTINGDVRLGFAEPSNLSQQYTNTTHEVLVYGPQLEDGAFATSLIPTEAATGAVTRAVDSADIIGSNFSSFYNPTESTILVDVRANVPVSEGGQRNVLHLGNDNANGYGFFKEGGGLNKFFHIRSGGSTISNFDSGVDFPYQTTVKLGAAFTNGDQAVYFDNVLRAATATTTGISAANITALNIGASNTQGANSWTGTISKVVYYGKRLSNTQLQLLTS